MSKQNKGFSLVELIIVIAIMAILVGVMAPQLLKYIEKTNISADVQLCDSVHTAIFTALMDPDVLSANDGSSDTTCYFTSGGGMHGSIGSLYSTVSGTVFHDEVCENLGFDPFVTSETRKLMKSKPAKTAGVLSFATIGNGSGFVVYIDHSDASGNGADLSVPTESYENLDKVICAPAYVS